MNYSKIYDDLITFAKNTNTSVDGYHEKHHILPRSMGGGNNMENLVRLTPRQHFIAHRLLEKITKGTNHHHKMIKAVLMMAQNNMGKHKVNSHTYDTIRSRFLKVASLARRQYGRHMEAIDISVINPDIVRPHNIVKGRIRKILKDVYNYKNPSDRFIKFILICISLQRTGFNRVVNSNSSSWHKLSITSWQHCISKGKVLGFIDGKGFLKIEEFLKVTEDLDVKYIPSVEKLFSCLSETIGKFTGNFIKYKINSGLYLITAEKVFKFVDGRDRRFIVLKPFNNWLTFSNPLLDYFYKELTSSEANEAILALREYQDSMTKKSS